MEWFPRACRQDAFAHSHASTLSWYFHRLVRTWLLASANLVGADHPVLPLVQKDHVTLPLMALASSPGPAELNPLPLSAEVACPF